VRKGRKEGNIVFNDAVIPLVVEISMKKPEYEDKGEN